MEMEPLSAYLKPVIKPNIDPEKWIVDPNTGELVTEYEVLLGIGRQQTFFELAKSGLYMPDSGLFMPYLVRVVLAYQGKGKLYDASGEQVKGKRLKNLYLHLTTNHINNGAWTHLNDAFVKGTGFNGLDLETVVEVDLKNRKLVTERVPLKPYTQGNCFVDLKFNEQGIATQNSKKQKYVRGKNILSVEPQKDCVARFYANSVDARWGGNRYRFYSYPSLGVYAFAEGGAEFLKFYNK